MAEPVVIPPAFRLSGRAVFLTYTKVPEDLSKEDLLAKLRLKCAPYSIEEYSIGRETHADGTWHMHAYLKFDRKANFRGSARLDLEGLIHGNYKPGKAVHIKYSQKDGDFITNCASAGSYIGKAKNGDFDGAIADFEAAHPMQYILNLPKVKSNLRLLGSPILGHHPYYGPWPEDLTSGTAGWTPKTTTLILLGPSGIGKTQWALAQFVSPLLISHSDGLKALRPEHDAVIFDDMSFNHWPRTSAIHLVDLECDRQINVKFGCVTLPARLPRILTSNSEWEALMPSDEAGAIKRRCKIVRLFPEQEWPIFNQPGL